MGDDSRRPIRILSLDGGGVRGLSAILILGHIMRNINSQRKKDGKEPQEPWEYFDLIGGTSTGGIIAIMLGRLRMTIPECITAYTELSETIFKPKRSWASPFRAAEYLNGDGKFDSQALEKEIKTQIQKSKVAANDDQILLMDTESPCKVCVFALQGEDSTLAILRTYDYPNASHTLFEECKVWEACRATSAAPTFFDPVQIGPYKQSFIDGGLRYNNPIFKVYGESQEIWPNRTIVVTSIGNGEPPGTNFSGNLKQIANSIAEIVTDCDRTADDFYNRKEYMIDKGCYFRLSVTHGLGSIGLKEHDHINEITDRTEVYLSRGEPRTKLNMCIRALLQEHVPRTMLRLNNIRNDACLESLAFEMNFWKENLVSANDDTCGWLLENNNYARWIQNDDGLLWIQGKAGVGKSTLMKYIYEKMETPTADVPSLQLSFFFHACGVELQKTPLGMFRSLLLQLYEGDLTARLRIRKVFDKSSEDGMVEVKWEKIAEELFSSVIRQISGSKKVTIFIDALDEAGEVVANDVASYFIILYKMVQQSNGTVKICFSSRPHPIISAKVADNQIITVEHENGRGIRLFVQNEFEGNLQDGRPIKSGEASLKLEGDIAARADVQKIRVKGETERSCDDMSILEFWIGDILMQKGTFDTKLRINLHELIRFVIDEYDFGYPLRHILTVTGSPIDAFTGTAESYVKCQWGENGLRILDWMSQLITNRDISPLYLSRQTTITSIDWVGSSKTRHNSDVAIVRISGTPDEIASTAMQLTWMATVFRKPSEEGLVVSRAKMEYIGYQEATGNSEEKSYRGFTIKLQSLNPVGGNNDRGGCWNPIFRSFVIADGFQIPSRPQLFSGIELPLSLLAVLAQVDYPLQYLDSCVLKGRKSAVVPVSSFDTIDGRWIQWHLIQSDNESDLSMEVVHRKAEECELVPCPVSFEYFVARLDDNDNEDRHFLGLYPSAAINLGTQGSHAEDIKSVRDIRLARGPKIIWKRNISPSIGIPLGAVSLGASTTFDMRLPNSARRQLIIDLRLDQRTQRACENLTILYDTTSKIAWLVPEICAILHLVQSHARSCQEQVSFPREDQMTPSKAMETCTEFFLDPESPSQIANCIRFQQFDVAFRQMKESIIIDRHGKLFKHFSSKHKLVGVEFHELSEIPDSYELKEVDIDKNNSGGWVKIVRDNGIAKDSEKILTLFCPNLSQPIRPSPQTRACGTWSAPLTKMDYLITTVFCIRILNKRHGSDPPKLSPTIYWASGVMDPFDECQGRCCNRLQKLSKNDPRRRDLVGVIDGAPEGAVIFGGHGGNAVIISEILSFEGHREDAIIPAETPSSDAGNRGIAGVLVNTSSSDAGAGMVNEGGVLGTGMGSSSPTVVTATV